VDIGYAILSKEALKHLPPENVSFEHHVDTLAFMGADGVIVTGKATGHPVDSDELAVAMSACEIPVIVGSGADEDSISGLLSNSDAVIVGSAIKENRHWSRPVDPAHAECVVAAARAVHP
jgi:predicted TIM-barrel enzyme